MNQFNFKRRDLLSGPHLLGTLLILAGIFALVSPAFFENENPVSRTLGVGVGAIVAGLLILSAYGGTIIDFKGMRFKEYFSFGGYKFGNWASLPPISIVKVIARSYRSTNTPNGISPTLSGKVTDFRIFAYSNDSKSEFSFIYSDRDKALDAAKNLASNLNADLVLNMPKSE